MTKKHFWAFAKVLSWYDDEASIPKKDFIRLLEGVFWQFNPRFNPNKFREACEYKGKE